MVRAAIIAVFLLLAGCGGENGAVEDRVKSLYEALRDRDAARVCGSLTADQRRIAGTGPRSCAEAVRPGLRYLARAVGEKLEVTGVEIEGERATATVETGGRTSRIGLRRERGTWLVSELNLSRL